MAEIYSKSKLKRKKSSVEDLQPDSASRGASRAHAAERRAAAAAAAEPERSEWWSRERLSAAESLWAMTLKSALPSLENRPWDLVPDLPQPSTEVMQRRTVVKLDEERWCDLSEEVPPFPEPSQPSFLDLPTPDPLRPSLSQSDPSAPDPPDRPLSPHSRQSQKGMITSPKTPTKRPRLSLHCTEEAASSSSAGPSNVGGQRQEKETGQLCRKPLTDQVGTSNRGDSQQEKGRHEKRSAGDGVGGGGGGVGGGGGGGGGGEGRLQSCPMCLMVFPAGFTQMDCDGHLAQCLSEVNVDVTW